MSFTNSSIICNADTNKFTMCISNDNYVYSFGSCSNGAYGHKELSIFPPKQIKGLENIKIISCCLNHSICIDYNGYIYSIGSINKQLKRENDNNELLSYIPYKINMPFPIIQVSCGIDFSICLTDNGFVYSFGENNEGQLGLGDTNVYTSPQIIPDFKDIIFICCGGCHTITQSSSNNFYSWGSGPRGELGQSNNESYNKPTQCNNWPDNIIDIKSGFYFSLLLTLEGKVYSFGSNFFGQLGSNDKNLRSLNKPSLVKNIPEIQRIQCGYNHSMCIDINNNLWLFGQNSFGQLGLGDYKIRYKPILHPILVNIIDVSSGGFHTFVKTIDNKIFAFGNNNASQLGINTLENPRISTPIQVFKENEDIWCSFMGKSKQKSARK